MASRRRGGRRSGILATPADGTATPPAVRQALAEVSSQLEDFAQQVGALKMLVRNIAGESCSPSSAGTTTDLDIEGFRRSRRNRTALLCGASVMVPLMFFASWALLTRAAPVNQKPSPHEMVGRPAHLPASAQDEATGKAPGASSASTKKQLETAAIPGPPSDARVPPTDPPAHNRPRRGLPPRAIGSSAVAAHRSDRQLSEGHTLGAPSPPLHTRPAARRDAYETSGGAPILD